MVEYIKDQHFLLTMSHGHWSEADIKGEKRQMQKLKVTFLITT